MRHMLCFPFENIEVAIDWFSAAMWGAIRVYNSPIGGASESACLADSVDREVCCARHSSLNWC